MATQERKKKRVVIVGGGFGGLSAAKKLLNEKSLDIILVDQRNHHLFQPLLYQVATAGLNPADIAAPIRAQFPGADNIEVHLARIDSIDLPAQKVKSEGRELSYDFLLLACGAQHSYFGKSEWEEYAPGLKTLEQATEIRRRMLCAFEFAESELDPAEQKKFLSFVIVGAGPTGVELAGAMADISRTVLVRDFRRINPAQARIILVEGGPKVLPSFSEKISAHTLKDLQAMGVEVRLGTKVEAIDAAGVTINGEKLEAKNVFWAAGVEAAKVSRTLGVELDRAGRVLVEPDLSLKAYPNVFVVGDAAAVATEVPGKILPGLAQVAMQGGERAAKNIIARIEGKPTEKFTYFNKGQLATIGKRRAVLEIKGFTLTGYFAWILWLFVHIFYLIGFKNRFIVLYEWAWSYIFSKRGARLITDKNWKLPK